MVDSNCFDAELHHVLGDVVHGDIELYLPFS